MRTNFTPDKSSFERVPQKQKYEECYFEFGLIGTIVRNRIYELHYLPSVKLVLPVPVAARYEA